MNYRVALVGGAHDGDVVETDERPPERILRVHRAGGRAVRTYYFDTGNVTDDGSLLYVVKGLR